jgi:tetratricopeptide (TPR) repeat protein
MLAPLLVGDIGERLWFAIFLGWLLGLAGVSSYIERSSLRKRRPFSWRVVVFVLLPFCLFWFPEHSVQDLFRRRLAFLVAFAVLSTGFAAAVLAGASRQARRWIRFSLLLVTLVEGGVAISQGVGCLGTYRAPGHLVDLLTLGVFVALGVIVRSKDVEDPESTLALLSAGVGTLAICLTVDLSGIAVFFICLAGLLWLLSRIRSRLKRLTLPVLFLGSGMLLLSTWFSWRPLSSPSLSQEGRLSEMPPRVPLNALLQSWEASPWKGIGVGSFGQAFALSPYEGEGAREAQAASDLVFLGLETGIPGLCLFLVGLLYLVRSLWEKYRQTGFQQSVYPKQARFAAVAMASLLSQLLAGFFNLSMFVPVNAVVLAVVVGLGMSEREKRPSAATGGGAGIAARQYLGVAFLVFLLALGIRLGRFDLAMDRGRTALRAGRVRDAVASFGEALSLQADTLEGGQALARSLLIFATSLEGSSRTLFLARVEKLCTELLLRGGRSCENLFLLGSTKAMGAISAEERERASMILREAKKLSPRSSGPILALANVAISEGDLPLAASLLTSGFARQPKGKRSLALFELFLNKKSDLSDVDAVLPRDCQEGWRILAARLQESGATERARAAWDQAVSLGPENPEIRCERGEFLLGKGLSKLALMDFEVARRSENTPTLRVYEGILQAAGALKKDVMPIIQDGVRIWPRKMIWQVREARQFYGKKDLKRALQRFRAVRDRFKSSPEGPFGEAMVLEELAEHLGDRRRLRRAASAYREALRRDPNHEAAERHLIDLYWRLGDRDRAHRILLDRQEAGRALARDYVRLARMAFKNGAASKALDWVGEALKIDSGLSIDGRPARQWMLLQLAGPKVHGNEQGP